ncbi:MAG TPA: hypothetical protein PKV35_01835, partial [bacterium]|nr:hypothetical protein [bacterium]
NSSIVEPTKTDKCDMTTTSSLMGFNGNDGLAIFFNGVIIDQIGVESVGINWDVAGVTGATLDHTLVRKAAVANGSTDWATSAGTTTEDSEWVVYPKDTFDYLGTR